MNTETLKLIEKLADKLGTTSEYLWEVLIKQAQVSAITDLVQYFMIILMGSVLYKLHMYFSKETGDYHRSIYSDKEEAVAVPMLLVFTIWLILVIAALFTVSNTISAIFNPEYWALKEILNNIY